MFFFGANQRTLGSFPLYGFTIFSKVNHFDFKGPFRPSVSTSGSGIASDEAWNGSGTHFQVSSLAMLGVYETVENQCSLS